MANEIYKLSYWGNGVCDNDIDWGIVYKEFACNIVDNGNFENGTDGFITQSGLFTVLNNEAILQPSTLTPAVISQDIGTFESGEILEVDLDHISTTSGLRTSIGTAIGTSNNGGFFDSNSIGFKKRFTVNITLTGRFYLSFITIGNLDVNIEIFKNIFIKKI